MEGVRLRAARRHLFYFPLLGRLWTEFAPDASLSLRPRGWATAACGALASVAPAVPSVHPPFHRVAAATRALLSGRGAAVRRSVLLVGRCVTRAPGARARVFFVLRTSRSSSLSSSLSSFCHAHVVLRTSRNFFRQPRRLRLSRAGAVSFSQGGRSPVHKLCRNPRITPEAVHLIHSLDANAFMQKENVRHPRPPRALCTVRRLSCLGSFDRSPRAQSSPSFSGSSFSGLLSLLSDGVSLLTRETLRRHRVSDRAPLDPDAAAAARHATASPRGPIPRPTPRDAPPFSGGRARGASPSAVGGRRSLTRASLARSPGHVGRRHGGARAVPEPGHHASARGRDALDRRQRVRAEGPRGLHGGPLALQVSSRRTHACRVMSRVHSTETASGAGRRGDQVRVQRGAAG